MTKNKKQNKEVAIDNSHDDDSDCNCVNSITIKPIIKTNIDINDLDVTMEAN